MSREGAGNDWELLKRKENCRDKPRHEMGLSPKAKPLILLATPAGYWGTGEPIFFHHGWPLSADDWDAQMMFFLGKGYRVIAHDRRGHGRSTQTATGHDMDTYADDAYEVVKKLDLKNAVHIGHSTGGGEVTRYVAGTARVASKKLS